MQRISPAAAAEKHLTIPEAEALAATVITDRNSALDEAIHMLTEIAHGRSYGTFEYMAKLMQMRKMHEPSACLAGAPTVDGVRCDNIACVCQPDRTNEDWLEIASQAQSDMWVALGKIEHDLDIEIDSTRDLGGLSVEDLDEDDEDDEDELPRGPAHDPVDRMYDEALKPTTSDMGDNDSRREEL